MTHWVLGQHHLDHKWCAAVTWASALGDWVMAAAILGCGSDLGSSSRQEISKLEPPEVLWQPPSPKLIMTEMFVVPMPQPQLSFGHSARPRECPHCGVLLLTEYYPQCTRSGGKCSLKGLPDCLAEKTKPCCGELSCQTSKAMVAAPRLCILLALVKHCGTAQ